MFCANLRTLASKAIFSSKEGAETSDLARWPVNETIDTNKYISHGNP
jgi:hypothetical protein